MFFSRVLLPYILVISYFVATETHEYKIIETNNGLVRGRRNETLLNKVSYYSFKGIPYAKPPIGHLRFKAPKPADSWKPAILDTFQHSNVCIQSRNLMNIPFTQSEDCLTLNIYVPDSNEQQKMDKLPVLFYIHGGGYVDGASNDYLNGHDFIIEHQVILVTFNYRLGIFGFLSLNSTEYSGNMGLKDQQLALKWINENIEHFGGDSKRITIFGHSAGGSSTHFHIVSAESRKYFRNAFCMSGTVEHFWAREETNDHLKLAYQIAEDLNAPQTSLEGLIKLFQSIEADKLCSYSKVNSTKGRLEITFIPVIERMDAQQAFLLDSPRSIYETSKIEVNAMFSFASLEILGMIFRPKQFPSLDELNANFAVGFPYTHQIDPDSEKYRNLSSEIRQFYFGNSVIDKKLLPQYVALFSDINFAHGVDTGAKLHASKSEKNTFYYRFSVDSKLNMYKRNNPIYLPGAAHADEHCYVFRCGMAQSIYEEIISNKNDEQSQISLQTINSITKLITNFAKYDEPSHNNEPIDEFLPIANNSVQFLDITNNGLILGLNPNKDANDLWTRIGQQVHSD